MSEIRVSVDNGKYVVVLHDNGGMYALRHGEPWSRDLVGDKLVYNLAYELDEARKKVEAYETALGHIAGGHPDPAAFAKVLLSI